MLARSGDITEPCPVPLSLTVTTPSSSTPAFNHFWIRRMMRRSPIRCFRKRIAHSLTDFVKEAADVGVENPVHLRVVDSDTERVERIVRAPPWPEPIREPEEVMLGVLL